MADVIAGEKRLEVMLRNADIAGILGTPGAPLTGAIAHILAGSWRGKPRPAINASGNVAHSLEAALWSMGGASSFRAAVLRAANLGEDSDTTDAITGQLAGALHRASGIPEDWRASVASEERIRQVAEELQRAR